MNKSNVEREQNVMVGQVHHAHQTQHIKFQSSNILWSVKANKLHNLNWIQSNQNDRGLCRAIEIQLIPAHQIPWILLGLFFTHEWPDGDLNFIVRCPWFSVWLIKFVFCVASTRIYSELVLLYYRRLVPVLKKRNAFAVSSNLVEIDVKYSMFYVGKKLRKAMTGI